MKTLTILAFLLLFSLAASMVWPSYGGVQAERSVSSDGSISYLPIVDVLVNTSRVIALNNLSLGFMLEYDWQTWLNRPVMQQLTQNASFKMVRIFSHRLEPCTKWNDTTQTGTFNWNNVDSLIRKLISLNIEPLICLGFCDSNGIIVAPGMQADPATGLPYPESFAKYCTAWVKHFESVGLPVKYYEVWNEPFFYFYKNWVYNETKLSYFMDLFNTCYSSMHSENETVLIGNDASLYKKFFDYWKGHGGKLDFFSFHKYDCDGTTMPDGTPLQRSEKRYFVTDSLWYGINDARRLWGIKLPAIATECNWAATCASGTDPRIQKVVGSVWLGLTLSAAVLNNVQYCIYYSFSSSKSWELAHKSTGGFGFGMINQDDNKPWYPYLLQMLMGSNLSVGDQVLYSGSSSGDVRTLSWLHASKSYTLVVCKNDQARIIRLQGFGGQLDLFRIDGNISYETPAIQTSRLSGDSFLADGYAVALLVSGS